MAIWDELANNGQAAGPSSVFQYGNVNSDTLAQVSRFLADANANSGNSAAVWLDSHVNVPEPAGLVMGQGFIAPTGTIIATPEPSTLVLAGLGLLSIAGGAIRRRRKAKIATV